MSPHYELNERFQGYIRRAQLIRRLVVASLAVVCLLMGSGVAFEMIAPPQSIAGAHLTRSLDRVQTSASDALASISNIHSHAKQQLAAASSLPWLDNLSDAIYRTLCPFFTTCEVVASHDATSPKNVNPPSPSKTNSYQATNSDIVKQVQTQQPTQPAGLTPSGAAASPRAVSSNSPAPHSIERVVETVRTVEAGINAAYVDARLSALQQSLEQRMTSMENANATSFRNVSSGNSNSGASSGAVDASAISGTITNAINSAVGTILDLIANTLVASNATFTNATTTNLEVTGTATIGSGNGVLQTTSGVVSTIAAGSNGQVLKLVGGAPTWSSDLQGSGGGSSAWATSTDDLSLAPSDTSDVVIIGSNATTTTGTILEVAGNSLFRGALTSYSNLTAPRFTATSSVASVFPFASTTAISASPLCLSADCRSAWPSGDGDFSTTSASFRWRLRSRTRPAHLARRAAAPDFHP